MSADKHALFNSFNSAFERLASRWESGDVSSGEIVNNLRALEEGMEEKMMNHCSCNRKRDHTGQEVKICSC